MSDAIDVVQRFCGQWAKGGGVDALIEYFTDDAVYHNIPVAPVTGRDAIRATIEMFTTGVERVEFRVLHIAAAVPTLEWGLSLSNQYLAADVTREAVAVTSGYAEVPRGAGLGVEVDEHRVREFEVRL